MRRWGLALATALTLAGCGFGSDQPFFGEGDAVFPLPQGARYVSSEVSEEPQHGAFYRNGAEYMIFVRGHQEPVTGVMLIDIPDTPEEDYVLQHRGNRILRAEQRTYAFVWRVGDGYRVFYHPEAFVGEQGTVDRRCVAVHGACMFRSREDLMAYYIEHAYPLLRDKAEGLLQDYIKITPDVSAAGQD